MLKEEYPIKFDDTVIPFYPNGYDRDDGKVTVVNQTEDGHDDVEMVRTEKTILSLSFLVNARWAGILQGYKNKTSIEVSIYDPLEDGYTVKEMWITSYTSTLEPYTDRLYESEGLYTVNLTLEEF